MTPPTLDEMIACARRELGMRHGVYPRWVAAGKLKQPKAGHEIACMAAILANLEAQRDAGFGSGK